MIFLHELLLSMSRLTINLVKYCYLVIMLNDTIILSIVFQNQLFKLSLFTHFSTFFLILNTKFLTLYFSEITKYCKYMNTLFCDLILF